MFAEIVFGNWLLLVGKWNCVAQIFRPPFAGAMEEGWKAKAFGYIRQRTFET